MIDLNACFGFPHFEGREDNVEMEMVHIWFLMTGLWERKSSSLASRIANPVWRQVQRLLASTLCARKDVSRVVSTDIEIMAAMAYGLRIDLGRILIEKL